ncbi:MAG: hypothetical protein ACYC5G_02830 [Candidatus Doudnabacteria bacterium]
MQTDNAAGHEDQEVLPPAHRQRNRERIIRDIIDFKQRVLGEIQVISNDPDKSALQKTTDITLTHAAYDAWWQRKIKSGTFRTIYADLIDGMKPLE